MAQMLADSRERGPYAQVICPRLDGSGMCQSFILVRDAASRRSRMPGTHAKMQHPSFRKDSLCLSLFLDPFSCVLGCTCFCVYGHVHVFISTCISAHKRMHVGKEH